MKTNIMVFLISASLVGTCFAQSMGNGSSSGSTYGNSVSTGSGSAPISRGSANNAENNSNTY